MIKAIIFNLEGVIIDTPFFNKNDARQTAREPGLTFEDEMFLNLYNLYEKQNTGEDDDEVNDDLDSDKLFEMENQGGMADMDQRTSITYDYNPDYFDGMEAYEDALAFLDKNIEKYRFALVSETRGSFISIALEKYQIADHFEVVVTSDNLKYAKPDAEIYETAVKMLELPKEEILVIEYAPYGIDAARDAGLKVVTVTNKYDEGELADADQVLNSLEDLKISEL